MKTKLSGSDKISLIVFIFALFAILAGICYGKYEESSSKQNEDSYFDLFMYQENTDIMVYDTKDLTKEVLENRNGALIIEKCIGVCTNSYEKTGCVLGADEGSDYISYSDMEDIREGTIIVSYFVYNPETNYCDDIIGRYDFVIDRTYED